jgi:DNA-directed RNA polymerase specialized sigma24 family protein
MASGGAPTVEPLTKSTREGVVYQRLPDVEAQIRASIGLRRAELVARAAIMDSASQEYLKEECLVHLVRAACLKDDVDGFNTAMGLLLRRCTRWIERGFRALGVAPQDVPDALGELVKRMTIAIVAPDDRGDGYQVCFWKILKRELLKIHDRYDRQRLKEKHQKSLSDSIGSEFEGEDGVVLEDIIPSYEDVAGSVERRMLIAEALDAIRDPRHREAFVLYHLEDWQIEAKDLAETSICKRFGVTSRTVNNWLRAAESDLLAWRAASAGDTGEPRQ